MDWQPIKTAPKDGTHVLLFARDCGQRDDCEVVIGYWQGMMYGTLSVNDEEWTGWLSVSTYDNGHGDSENARISPTHWLPLPTSPVLPAPSGSDGTQDEERAEREL